MPAAAGCAAPGSIANAAGRPATIVSSIGASVCTASMAGAVDAAGAPGIPARLTAPARRPVGPLTQGAWAPRPSSCGICKFISTRSQCPVRSRSSAGRPSLATWACRPTSCSRCIATPWFSALSSGTSSRQPLSAGSWAPLASRRIRWARPMMVFIGVRISWPKWARNSLLARVAAWASSRERAGCAVRSSIKAPRSLRWRSSSASLASREETSRRTAVHCGPPACSVLEMLLASVSRWPWRGRPRRGAGQAGPQADARCQPCPGGPKRGLARAR